MCSSWLWESPNQTWNRRTWLCLLLKLVYKLHIAALVANQTQWIQFIELKWRMVRDSLIWIRFDGSQWIAHIHGSKYQNIKINQMKEIEMIWSVDQLLFPFVIWFICRYGHAKQYCAQLLCGILITYIYKFHQIKSFENWFDLIWFHFV